MKFFHISDLHLGKRLNDFSLIEDQRYALTEIACMAAFEEKPDAVVIAGDIYDKSVPTAEAVTLFDEFLNQLYSNNINVIIISGNHDSAERVSFGASLMNSSGVYIAPPYSTEPYQYTVDLEDEFGTVHFHLLPFIKPVNVRQAHPELEISSYNDAIKVAVEDMEINETERNILVTHQFVTGSVRCDSEAVSVGGTDNVDAEIFDQFDYVALGHIHNPQSISRESVRYCGSPLKYSFSEANVTKSITIVEVGEKGKNCINIRTADLSPLHDLKEIKGSYDELTLKSFYIGTSYMTDYMHITLTDEEDVPDAISKLRPIYKNIMKLDYDNTRTRTGFSVITNETSEEYTPSELFSDFYEKVNGKPMSDDQSSVIEDIISKIWRDEQ